PFLRPSLCNRRAAAHRSCQEWPLLERPPVGLVLDGCEHGGIIIAAGAKQPCPPAAMFCFIARFELRALSARVLKWALPSLGELRFLEQDVLLPTSYPAGSSDPKPRSQH